MKQRISMKRWISLLASCLSCGGLAAGGAAGAAPSLLGGDAWVLLSPKGAADLKTQAAGTAQALRVTIHKPSTPYYATQLTHDIESGTPAGAVLQYRFSARSATGNPIHVVIEKRTAPYTHVLDRLLTLTPAWKEYVFTAPVGSAFGPRGMAARLQLGLKSGVVEFKGLTLTRN